MKPQRQCNGCKACCYTHAVPDSSSREGGLVTGLFSHCRFECAKGCRIYQLKPAECTEYKCGWLKGEFDGPRPDELGLVLDNYVLFDTIKMISAMEVWPGASKTKKAREFIRKLAETNVVAVAGPTHLRVMGPVDRQDDIKVVMGVVHEVFGMSGNSTNRNQAGGHHLIQLRLPQK